MLGQQFYHETIRKVVVSFGSLFNDIHLVRKDNSGTIQQSMKVPLAYGPRQKFLVRLNDDPSLAQATAVTLPRIGFEITGMAYDPSRKLQQKEISSIIPNLDLVISSDTSLLHLSASLNHETWGILNLSPDWRWGEFYKINPYNKVKFFHQKNFNNWNNVENEIFESLSQKLDLLNEK